MTPSPSATTLDAPSRVKAVISYPSKIVATLLNMRLVEDDMVRGGVLAALRRANDWVRDKDGSLFFSLAPEKGRS